MKIRLARPSDLAELAELRGELVDETFTRPYPPPAWENRRRIFETSIAEELLFVADSAEGLVGFAVGAMHPFGVGSLDFLHVREASRRRGVARNLVAELSAALAARGARWIHVEVEADNAAARSVYERWGFSTCALTLISSLAELRERLGAGQAEPEFERGKGRR